MKDTYYDTHYYLQWVCKPLWLICIGRCFLRDLPWGSWDAYFFLFNSSLQNLVVLSGGEGSADLLSHSSTVGVSQASNHLETESPLRAGPLLALATDPHSFHTELLLHYSSWPAEVWQVETFSSFYFRNLRSDFSFCLLESVC